MRLLTGLLLGSLDTIDPRRCPPTGQGDVHPTGGVQARAFVLRDGQSRSAVYSSARNISAAFTRLLTSSASASPSFRKIELMCFSTARLVSTSESAIAPLLFPVAISASTSR